MDGVRATYHTPTIDITPTNDLSVHAFFYGESVGIGNDQPTPFALAQNTPNPFNPTTIISFSLPTSEYAQLSIYTVAGQRVRTLLGDNLSAGIHHVTWDGSDQTGRALASGVYIYRLTTPNGTLVRRLMLLR